MGEPSLSVTKTELDVLIGFHLGYGRTSGNWSSSQQSDIDDARDYAVARLYDEHDWSFLSPVTTIDTTADDDEDDLPDDFGYLRETFYYAADVGYAPPRWVSSGEIYKRKSISDASGIIQCFAIEPKTQTGAAGQRWQVLWSPAPNDAYTLTYRYKINRDALSASYPYPAGGPMFRNTLVSACLAAADLLFRQERGIHEQVYQENLTKAILNDARIRPMNMGYNQDSSDAFSGRRIAAPYALYEGSLPS